MKPAATILYEFQFVDAEGGRPGFDFSQCASDDEAARRALAKLAMHTSCRGVEIYEGERLVARLEKPRPEGMEAGDIRLRR